MPKKNDSGFRPAGLWGVLDSEIGKVLQSTVDETRAESIARFNLLYGVKAYQKSRKRKANKFLAVKLWVKEE